MADSNDHAATSPEPVKGLPDRDASTSLKTVEGPAGSIPALPALVASHTRRLNRIRSLSLKDFTE